MSKVVPLRPKAAIPITRSMLTNIKMVSGGEKDLSKVIFDGRVREWIGFGWIDIRAANASDYAKYPAVVD
jgi:hypothetical protein